MYGMHVMLLRVALGVVRLLVLVRGADDVVRAHAKYEADGGDEERHERRDEEDNHEAQARAHGRGGHLDGGRHGEPLGGEHQVRGEGDD